MVGKPLPTSLDAGVPLRDVQEAASHADPRTTMRYDRARGSLDRHATYIVAAYIAGSRPVTQTGWNSSVRRAREPVGPRMAGAGRQSELQMPEGVCQRAQRPEGWCSAVLSVSHPGSVDDLGMARWPAARRGRIFVGSASPGV